MRAIQAIILVSTVLLLKTLVYSAEDTLSYSVFMGSRLAGEQLHWTDADGSLHYYYTFNDRGRGPSLTQKISFDKDELMSIEISGHDYTKNQVHESFRINQGLATWQNISDTSSKAHDGEYYFPINGTPGGIEGLIKILANSNQSRIALLPEGQIEVQGRDQFNIDGHHLTLWSLGGVSYEPSFFWMTDQYKLFAIVSPSRGITCIQTGMEPLKNTLAALQVGIENAYFESLANRLSKKPDGATAIENVSVFNALTGKIDQNRTLIFEGNKIIDLFQFGSKQLPANCEAINGQGRTLLPGLFDMHVHIGKSDGLLHIAGGVTAVRDMAVQNNYILDKQKLGQDFEANQMIGPRIIGLAGFIDGNGPFTRDKGIDSLEQGLDWIDEFAAAGLQQIKLYSSIKPEWVRPLAERAHNHGIRVSGHIPAFMTATQAIKDGFDEIQHTNMLFLNFYGDTLDTRNMTRFSAVGEQAHRFDFHSKEFNHFVELLKEEEIIIDPTLAIFEWGFRSVSGQMSPTYEKIVHRLPLTARRRYLGGGFARPPGMHQRYLQSYDRMVEMVYHLYEAGVSIVPGTDNLPGFAFHRELELYVSSGIPSSEVLRMATILSAQVAGRDSDLGSLEVGKLADMVLIEGDPVQNISAIRSTVLTVKDGIIYDSNQVYSGVGVEPR